ncbi:MAG: T9SS type A sorting domain-containing protein [Bacteroidales bacterium]|nr:T9SS type A sorting domain-containing protein [Bacteroidales bacterium]
MKFLYILNLKYNLTLLLMLLSGCAAAQLSFSRLSNAHDFTAESRPDTAILLPFVETWDSGLFETNLWETGENSHWRISGQVGLTAPSVEFYYNPPLAGYQQALTSRLLSAENLIDWNIFLSFSLKHSSFNYTGLESMKAQVNTGSNWTTVWEASNTELLSWETYTLNITSEVIGQEFRIRFLAEGQNSADIIQWLIDNIKVLKGCAIPTNLKCDIIYPNYNQIVLSWDPPGFVPSAWMHWDNGMNHDAIGLTDGGTFMVAARFTEDDLAPYASNSLTRIRFFPNADADFELKVWVDENGSQPVTSQIVDSITAHTWNEIILSNPVLITGTTELWIGYSVTHVPGILPAGIDYGPAEAGFGDLISLDGTSWVSMATEYNFNNDWNIQGLISQPDGKLQLLSTSNPAQQEFPALPDQQKLYNRQLQGYNIYDCSTNIVQLIGSTTETTFIYEPTPPNAPHCFIVSAVYEDCEGFSGVCGIIVSVNEAEPVPFGLYPVPADEMIYLSLDEEIDRLLVTDLLGRAIWLEERLERGVHSLNTSWYNNGIYILKIQHGKGKTFRQKFVVSH